MNLKIMKCECINEIKEALLKATLQGKKVLESDFKDYMLYLGSEGRCTTYSDFQVVLDTRPTKWANVSIAHFYCPFCGKPTGKDTGSYEIIVEHGRPQ